MKLLFCKFYQLFKYLNVDRIPQYSAVGILAILLTFNVIALGMYIQWGLGHAPGDINLVRVLLIYLAMFGFCYWRFVRKDRFVTLCKTFHRSKINSGPTATLITIAYTLISLLLFFSLIRIGR